MMRIFASQEAGLTVAKTPVAKTAGEARDGE